LAHQSIWQVGATQNATIVIVAETQVNQAKANVKADTKELCTKYPCVAGLQGNAPQIWNRCFKVHASVNTVANTGAANAIKEYFSKCCRKYWGFKCNQRAILQQMLE